MKKALSFACIGFMMASCATKSYIQIVDVKSESLTEEKNNYVYTDENCKIVYDLWQEGGNPGFMIENISDQLIYINLANSFFTENGIAYDYFRNRTYGKGSISSVSKGASASASVFGVWALSKMPGSKSATITDVSSVGKSSSITYSEKDVIVVPPHTSKFISEYLITNEVMEDCSINMFPKKGRKEEKSFTEYDTPIKFENYITYKVGENGEEKHICHKFYVAGYTNYNITNTEEKTKIGCKEQKEIIYNKYSKGTKYYIRYDRNHSNLFSADAKVL